MVLQVCVYTFYGQHLLNLSYGKFSIDFEIHFKYPSNEHVASIWQWRYFKIPVEKIFFLHSAGKII